MRSGFRMALMLPCLLAMIAVGGARSESAPYPKADAGEKSPKEESPLESAKGTKSQPSPLGENVKGPESPLPANKARPSRQRDVQLPQAVQEAQKVPSQTNRAGTPKDTQEAKERPEVHSQVTLDPKALETAGAKPGEPEPAFIQLLKKIPKSVLIPLGFWLLLGLYRLFAGVFEGLGNGTARRGGQADATPASKSASVKRGEVASHAGHRGASHIAVNDAPLTRMEEDRLGFRSLALNLARFLRHKKTEPPITLAVTGGWGSGKSSLMGMIFSDLRAARFRPVWFNAWHHHEEEHLFAALLEHIRNKAIQPWWTFSGFWFKTNLVFHRVIRRPAPVLLLAAAVLWMWPLRLSPADIIGLFQTLGEPAENFWADVWPDLFRTAWSLCPTLVLVTAPALGLLRAGSAFGLKPGRLFRRISRAVETPGLKTDPGVRYKVDQALGDITRAMGQNHLAIFIDDLDRCPAEKILCVLESLNFISTAPCRPIVVLGMALDKVLPSISSQFTGVVEESFEEIPGEPPALRINRRRAARRAYAKNYLEKLITMEVHVPAPSRENMADFLSDPRGVRRVPVNEKWKRIASVTSFLDSKIFPLFLFGLLMLAAWNGQGVFAPSPSPSARVPAGQEALPVQPAPLPEGAWLWLLVVFSAGLALFVFAAGYARRVSVVKDSSSFEKALRIWTDVFLSARTTPRDAKRYLNQLRLQSIGLEIKKAEEGAEWDLETREVNLVVLKALREAGLDPRLSTKWWAYLRGGLRDKARKEPDRTEPVLREIIERDLHHRRSEDSTRALAAAMVRHLGEFGGLWPSEFEQREYSQSLEGIVLR